MPVNVLPCRRSSGRAPPRSGPPRFAGQLEHWHFDTFRISWADAAWLAAAGPGWANFRLGRDGTVESLELEAIPTEKWILERLPEAMSR